MRSILRRLRTTREPNVAPPDAPAPAAGDVQPAPESPEIGHDLEPPAPYDDAADHLADEMRWLDDIICAAVQKRRRRAEASPEPLKGLFISEAEIDGLLRETDEGGAQTVVHEAVASHAARRRRSIDARLRCTAELGGWLPLVDLAVRLKLSPLEYAVIVTCLASEIDRRYGKLFAYLQDDVTRRAPSIDLLRTLGLGGPSRDSLRALLSACETLRRYRLVQLADTSAQPRDPLLIRRLMLDENLTDHLFGLDATSGRIGTLALPDPGGDALSPDTLIEPYLASYLRDRAGGDGTARVVCLSGLPGSGRLSAVRRTASKLGRRLLVIDGERLAAAAGEADILAVLAVREAFLKGALFCVTDAQALAEGEEPLRRVWTALFDAVALYDVDACILSERPLQPRRLPAGVVFLCVPVDPPGPADRLHLWRAATRDEPLIDDDDCLSLASAFRFTPGDIARAVADARAVAAWRHPGPATGPHLTAADVMLACRALSSPNLSRLAVKVVPTYGWRDIVLPKATEDVLRELCMQARARAIVMGAWGFDRKLSHGKGLTALFAGPPGTGKTMAAEVIAGELGLDLYKIDLSQVISKYIGETEKNLDRVFTGAAQASAILFFDEADALFGKRSEVRDSHDRYANVEISYLLQKMEEYDGVAILATNLRQNLDEAFLRRLRYVIEFPFPDAALRRRIWEVIFPDETPRGTDFDPVTLAREVDLSGGNIKNIALNAASLAAVNGGPVAMRHLLQAAGREYAKVGRKWRLADLPAGEESAA